MMSLIRSNAGGWTVAVPERLEVESERTPVAHRDPDLQFELLETMLWDGGILLETLHLDRLEASARFLGWTIHRSTIEDQLSRQTAAVCQAGQPTIAHLWLNSQGLVRFGFEPFVRRECMLRVCIATERTLSKDPFRLHRTTNRELYDRSYNSALVRGFDDVLFTNEKGELTEGTIHNVFIKKAGKLLTPPIECGVLPGVYRRHLLETNPHAEECTLYPHDVVEAETVYLSDAIHGLSPALVVEEQ